MNQRFNGPIDGGVAGRDVVNIHSISCPGRAECPHQDLRESKLQADFYRDTGIWAPPAARAILEMLMQKEGFMAPKLAVAWKANSLQWNFEESSLKAKAYWFEPLLAYMVIAIMCMYYLIDGLTLVFKPHPEAWRNLAAFATATALYGGMLYVATRYLLMPYRVARKVQQALQSKERRNE